ncbi:MAG: hypothetical protein ACPGN3_06840 [Opitutales bacterium]
MISVWLKEEKRAMWVPAGEEVYPGFPVFSKFDTADRSFWVNEDGRREKLALAEADFTKARSLGAGAASFVSGSTPKIGNKRSVASVAQRQSGVSSNLRTPTKRNASTARPVSRPRQPRVTGRQPGAVSTPRAPPPSFVGGRPFVRATTPTVGSNTQANNNNSTTNPNTSQNGNTSTGTQDPGSSDASNNQSPEVQRPGGAPPDAPTSAPPQNIPQLPPGFDLEQYLRDRANGGG